MKKKTTATWLALVLGVFGIHWFYLRKKRAWIYLALFPIALYIGFFDALRLGLMADTKWNRLFNPEHPDTTPQTNSLTIIGVCLALGVGITLLMSTLAVIFQIYFAGSIA